jgi:GNAT superfamily N-acetyltransferase
MRGFSEGAEPPEEAVGMFITFCRNPCSTAWLAESEDAPLAGAAMGIYEGAAMFYGDATLPEARRRGAQSALVYHRLLHAQSAGCDLAMACTLPGSISQRNYERFGFRVAYTKVLVMREWA